jgi:hypothetical protein
VRVYSRAHSRMSLSLQRGARCSVLHRVASISLARPPSRFAYLWDPHRQPDSSTRATSARDPPGQSLSFPAAKADRLQPNAANHRGMDSDVSLGYNGIALDPVQPRAPLAEILCAAISAERKIIDAADVTRAAADDSRVGGRRVPDEWLGMLACVTRTSPCSFREWMSSGGGLIARRSNTRPRICSSSWTVPTTTPLPV